MSWPGSQTVNNFNVPAKSENYCIFKYFWPMTYWYTYFTSLLSVAEEEETDRNVWWNSILGEFTFQSIPLPLKTNVTFILKDPLFQFICGIYCFNIPFIHNIFQFVIQHKKKNPNEKLKNIAWHDSIPLVWLPKR